MEYNAYLSTLLATHEQSDIITPHRLVGISSPLGLPTTSIISSSPHLNYVAANFMFLGKMSSSNSQAPRTLAPATVISPLANNSVQETVVKPIRKRTNACEACKKRKTKV